MKSKAIVTLLLALVILIIVGCSPAPTPEPTPVPPTAHPGKALVTKKCVGCHEINRVTNAAYDRDGWQLTVDRMVLSGVQLSDEQTEMVVDYLAQAYPKE